MLLLKTKPSVVFRILQRRKSFHHNLCTLYNIYMQIALYMKTFLLCKAMYGFCYFPTIKVYQHKLNKKEFKLAFKLWCACVRSSTFSLSIMPWWWYSYFFYSANHTQVARDTWDQVSSTPRTWRKKASTLSLPRIHLLTMQIVCKFQFSCFLPSYWIFQGFHYNYKVWVILRMAEVKC
jgi:hypothetical protein